MVYLDINELREINDSFGHGTGSKMIKGCADIVKNSVGSKYLYRIGGDRFVIIYVDITEESSYDSVQLLKNVFEKSRCQAATGCKWDERCTHIQGIIKETDELMYDDKKWFYQGHRATGHYRHNSDVLRFLAGPDVPNGKIENHNSKVYLQPKINMEDYRVVGVEALIRYRDKNGAIIAPDKLIPVLEDTYLVSKIDYYVSEEICKTLSVWARRGKSAVTISSNSSELTFRNDRFVERLEEISDKYHVQRSYLEIETTGSADFTNLDALVTKINQVRDSGFRVVMDNFGVESSNLALLSLAKFDILKIDKKFVKDITSNKRVQIIIGVMTRMCSRMGIQSVAEEMEGG